MPHWLIQEARTGGRILAGPVACVCFYVAFFLYEDQEGIWQNRIDSLWIAVYDRAKITKNTSTALLNTVGKVMSRFCDRLFGDDAYSLKAAVVSINLSLAGLCIPLPHLFVPFDSYTGTPALALLVFGVMFTTLAILPAISKSQFIIVWSGFGPMLAVIPIAMSLTDEFGIGRLLSGAILLSIAADFVAISVVRRMFKAISSTVDGARVFQLSSYCFGLALFVEVFPLWLENRFYVPKHPINPQPFREDLVGMISQMNIPTFVLCISPILILIVAGLSRVFWPIVSKALYPLSRFAIVKNRKFLIATGSLFLTYAAVGEHISFDKLVGLFGKVT